jgi:hypothetical protein
LLTLNSSTHDERAVRLHTVAEGLQTVMGTPPSVPEQFIVEHYLKPAAARLPEDVRDRAREAGLAMTQDEAIAYALGEPETPSFSPTSRCQDSRQ